MAVRVESARLRRWQDWCRDRGVALGVAVRWAVEERLSNSAEGSVIGRTSTGEPVYGPRVLERTLDGELWEDGKGNGDGER